MAVALIVAAGSGQRLGAGAPKALVEVAGRSLLQRSIDVLLEVEEVAEIVVALPEGVDLPSADALAVSSASASAPSAIPPRRGGPSAPQRVKAVRGGLTRSESVREALRAAGDGPGSQVVVVHDAARPMASRELMMRVIAAVSGWGVDAAVAASPVSDTIKRANPVEGEARPEEREGQGGSGQREGGEAGAMVEALPRVSETLRRSGLWAVQTPQAFRRGALERALSQPVEVLRQATDDACLIEGLGGTVVVVPSSPENFKITTPFDLKVASLVLSEREPD